VSNPRTPLLRRVLFATVVVVGFFATLELVASRIELPARFRRPEGFPAHLQVGAELGWQLEPGAVNQGPILRQWEQRWGLPPADLSDDVVSSQGFRDTELAQPKPEGQVRVLCLGDSSVWGQGVVREHTFAQRLEAALNPAGSQPGGRSVEVINAGVSGYSSFQSLLVMQQASGLGIDHYLVYNMNSDMMPALGVEDQLAFDSAVRQLLAPSYHRLATMRWLHALLRDAWPPSREPQGSLRVSLPQYIANLEAFVSLARQRGAAIDFVIPPQREDLREPGRVVDWSQRSRAELEGDIAQAVAEGSTKKLFYRAAMALVARREGIAAVDGPLLFSQAAQREPEAYEGAGALFVDDMHPSSSGHALLAEAILPLLEDHRPR
jgi:lysophospholipase L1-like esterase